MSSSSSSAAAAAGGDLRSAVSSLLEANPGGLTQKQLLRDLPPSITRPEGTALLDNVMRILQSMVSASRVEILQSKAIAPNGKEVTTTIFRRVPDEVASKLQGLSSEETAVLNLIEKTGNAGMWVRNLKLTTKLQLTALNKALKKLEKLKLIKPVKSIAFKNRRMYMAYDVEPAKEVTGGIWYAGQSLDDDFIESIREAVLLIMKVRKLFSQQSVQATGGLTLLYRPACAVCSV